MSSPSRFIHACGKGQLGPGAKSLLDFHGRDWHIFMQENGQDFLRIHKTLDLACEQYKAHTYSQVSSTSQGME